MKIISAYSTQREIENAFNEVKNKLDKKAKLILFFASTNYEFNRLTELFREEFEESEVVGVTTTGEITVSGLKEFSLSATSWSGEDVNVKAVLMNDIEKYPIFYRDELKSSLKQVGINPDTNIVSKEGLGLVFPTGLIGAEEKMLSVVNSVFKYDGFPLFGGTAGDNAKFEKTYVSYNGIISSNGGVVVFVKTTSEFHMHKENIFVSTGKMMKVTKADTESRTIYELNGKKASSEYARLLGVPERELSKSFMTNPLGRKINNELWIASPFQVLDNGAIQFYCQIFQDSVVYILEPKPPVETLRDTVTNFSKEFSRLDGVLAVNCILRKLQFESQNIVSDINNEIKRLPNLCGFSSYGEQLNRNQLNQTLVLLGFGKRR